MRNKLIALLLTLLGFVLTGLSVVSAQSEPEIVSKIRGECQQVDKQVNELTLLKFSSSDTYFDNRHRVRKIQGHSKRTSSGSEEWLYYFDGDEYPLFAFTKGNSRSGSKESRWENRYYFQKGDLAAWKKENNWILKTSPAWSQAAITARISVRDILVKAHNAYQSSLSE
jgi:hypothetical protein